MKKGERVSYEWDIETFVAPDGDIIDHHHSNTIAGFAPQDVWAALNGDVNSETNISTRLVLVRDVGDEVDGMTDRQWAYVEDMRFPDAFDNGALVPKRFIDELHQFTMV